jgi:AmmeMemoRadiSam system protein A
MLSLEEKRELLQIARQTLESYLRDQIFLSVTPNGAGLKENAGAFVTLEKQGMLRGCIGHMAADRPLYLAVQEMAIQAATGDPRFSSVTRNELPEIEIEISVLSPFRRISDSSEIRIGEHGLVVSQGMHRGVLLPQVPVREGWDREKFLGYTCRKAGLPFESWKTGNLQIEIFSAEVFGEREING